MFILHNTHGTIDKAYVAEQRLIEEVQKIDHAATCTKSGKNMLFLAAFIGSGTGKKTDANAH